LWESSSVRRWGLVVLLATGASTSWILAERPLDHLAPHGPPAGAASTTAIVREAIGQWDGLFRQMVGVFGWLDTHSPALTYIAWTVGIALLVGACLAVAARRHLVVLAVVLMLTFALPIALETSQARKLGVGWEGFWTLPLAVGIPVIAALGIACVRPAVRVMNSRVPLFLAGLFCMAQFLSFAEYMRRNTVGPQGSLTFWLRPAWSPPLPPLFLLIADLVLLGAMGIWLWLPDARGLHRLTAHTSRASGSTYA